MRIRSIKPDFWRSQDISSIEDWNHRLVFIGLWSYVDDNGVGLDRLSLIASDLFADDVQRDPSDTFARVSRALLKLSEADRIVRYTVGTRQFLYISNWSKHQRIDKPNKPRFPLPTSDDAQPSRDTRESPAPGAVEQRNRGTVERTRSSASPKRVDTSEFDAWWNLYPRKVSRGRAEKAYRAARKIVDAETLGAAVSAYAKSVADSEPKFIAYGASWLNDKRWLDEDIQLTTGPAIEDWLRECWTKSDTAAITTRCGLEFQMPDIPDDVDDARAFTVQARRDWIKTNHRDIVDHILEREAS